MSERHHAPHRIDTRHRPRTNLDRDSADDRRFPQAAPNLLADARP